MRNDLLKAAQKKTEPTWGNLYITIPVIIAFASVFALGLRG